jgi:hypothetical protein
MLGEYIITIGTLRPCLEANSNGYVLVFVFGYVKKLKVLSCFFP